MDQQKESIDTDTLAEDLGESFGYVQAFVRQEVESVKLDIAEKISIASSAVITGVFLTIFITLIAIFAAIALALFIGSLLESSALGFLLVAGFFLILLLLVYYFRKPLITDQVVEGVIHLFFEEQEDEINS